MQHQTTHPIQTHQLLLPARAAIYARVSSDQQAERQTIGSQVSDLLARAAAEGRDIGEEFRFLDDGQSGASLVRPALERLRDLVAMSAIEVVYVHAPDRLARSYAHQAVLIEEFARAGTQVVFLNRPIGQSPEDNLLLQLQGMFAEYERARMLERSRRGKRYLAQVGSVSVLSRAPYGYGYVGRGAGGGVARFEVIEEKAQVVRQIFQWVGHERVSLSAVSRRLFEAGVPSPTGNAHWSRSMLWTLLSNPAYAGQAVFGKNTSIPWRPPLRPARGRARVPKRPFRQIPASREHWVRIAVPAMIEAELFESAQEQLAENRRRHRQRCAGVRYLLQGLLVCRKCGYAFCGRWQPRYPREPGRGYHYYRCSGTESHRFHGQRRCDARVVPVAPLDTAVWEQVCRLLEDPAHVLHEYERRLHAARTGPRRVELEAVDRQLTKVRGGIGRLIDSYAEGLIAKAEFEPRLSELRRRVAKLEAEAGALKTSAEQTRCLQLVIGKLEAFAAIIADRLEVADWATQRDLIRTLVQRIEIDDDHVRVVFRIDPGPSDRGGSRSLLQHCPPRDQQLSCQGHDQGLARGAARVRGPRPVPACQRALRLEPQEAPGQRDHPAAHPRVAGLGEPFLSPPTAALVRRAGEAGIARHRPSVPQGPGQDLVHQHVGGLNPDPEDARQQAYHGVGPRLRVLLKLVQTRRFDLSDLVQDKAQARHVAPQLGQGIGREGRPFGKPQGAQALRRLAQGGLEAPNAEPSQSALDPIDQAGALTNQAFALTGGTLSIFLFERRDLGHAAVAPLAAQPAQEGPLQQRGIESICFSPPVLARDGDAGWVDHMGFDAVSA